MTGTLVVKENKTIAGYTIDETARTQTVTVNPEDVQTLTFYNIPSTTLVIEKYAEGTTTPLKGVTFLVTDSSGAFVGKSNGEHITDENGRIEIPGLTPGETITAKEIKAPDGYVLDGSPKSIRITEGEAHTLKFYNQPLCNLTLTKRDAVTGKPVPGTEFTLKDGNGNIIGKYTTGKDGTITVNGLVPGSTVVAVETKVPAGYALNSTPQTITLKSGTGNSVVSGSSNSNAGTSGGNNLDFENDPTTTLVIQKLVDGADNQPLKGVEFLVTDGRGTPVGPDNGRYVTDKDGRISIPDLEPGTTITARETKTVAGYILDTAPQTIQIKAGDVQTLTFTNQKAGSLIIKKQDSITKKPLAGVEFKITYADGSFVDMNGGTVSTKGIYWTDQNGEIVINGITGSLIVTETKTIDGYVINEGSRSQTVQINPNDTQTVYFYNEPLCSLTLTKRDSVTGKPVPGTEFTLKDGNGGIIGKYTTGKDGTVTVTGLVPGSTVVAVETRVPKGYVLNPLPQTIVVKNGTGNSVVSSNTGSSNSGNTATATGGNNGKAWTLRTIPPPRWSSRKLRTARKRNLCRAWNS